MYVLTEKEYLEYKSNHDNNLTTNPALAKCPIDGRQFDNVNILGHHLKTHVNGFKCNICGKVFKSERTLNSHLKQHPLQAHASTHSIFDNSSNIATIKPKKLNKHRSILKFDSTKWLSLK